MIVEWMFERLTTIGRALVDLLPEDPVGLGDLDATGVVHLFSWLDEFAPATETIELLILSVEVIAIIGVVYVVMWVLRRLPFGMGGT